MFGLLGDADASSDSAVSEAMSTIANNITDAVSQAASSASEFFPDLVHGSLRALQNNDDGSGSGSGSGDGGHSGGSSGGWIAAVIVVGVIGFCALSCWLEKKCKSPNGDDIIKWRSQGARILQDDWGTDVVEWKGNYYYANGKKLESVKVVKNPLSR